MPLEVRSLIFIFIFVAVPIFLFLRFAKYHSLKAEVKKWVIVWGLVTSLAFLSPNFWVFASIVTAILIYFTKNDNILKISLFFVLLPSVPAGSITIPGFGLINFLFDLDFPLLLSIVLLVPIMLTNTKSKNKVKSVNVFIYAFIVMMLISIYRDSSYIRNGVEVARQSSITNLIRYAFILTLTILVPLAAFTRSIKTSADLNKILLAIVFGILLQAAVGIGESVKSWHLYNVVSSALGLDGGVMSSLRRENLIRSSAALVHPIILGYVVMIGFGCSLNFFPIKKDTTRRLYYLLSAVFIVGLLSTLSRGPWVATVAMIMCFYLLGNNVVKNLSKFSLLGVFSLLFLSLFASGQRFIGLLPFIGDFFESSASATITYREQLIEQSWKVIQKNPFLGSSNYMNTPEMEVMRQGEGIIDIVNSYLRITLESGFVGLTFFLLIFCITLIKLKSILRTLKKHTELELLHNQGKSLFVVIIGIMITIFTVSTIGVIPNYIWTMIALCIAYINLANREIFALYSKNT